jgi:hypothetical protein
MTGILNALIAGVSGAVKDAYFNLVSLLLPGNGTNGAQNNTFLDSGTANSGSGFTITRNGNTTQGTFSPFSQTGWGNYFDGTGDCLSIPTSAISSVGSNDFSMECWVYLLRQTNTLSQGLISYGVSGSTAGTSYISFELTPSGYAAVAFASATALAITSSTITPINQWAHIALCRSGSTLSIFLNGSRVATTSTSATVGSTGNVLFVGSQWYANEATRNLQGYISNARIVNGSSAYDATQSTINVPTLPLTAISNTSLLTCQSNRFKDSSSTPLTVTPSGNTSVTPFSPFAPTSSYSAAAVGGSGYFDGTGDYLSVADNTALDMEASDFTMECWVYLNETPSSSDGIFAKRTDVGTFGGVLIYFSGLTPNFYATLSGSSWGIAFSSSIAATLNAWTHLAFTRSGSTWTIYVNGVSGGTGNSSGTVPNNTSAFVVGAYSSDGNATYLFPAGYISNVRVVKGTAIVPPAGGPTAPLTAVPNTSLLLNFTNAGVVDATAKNVLETVGNAQISTTQSKWGGGSIYFDGNGDRATMPGSALLALGSGDFTVEAWVYKSANTAYMTLGGNWASAGENTWQILADATGNKICWFAVSGFVLTSSATLNTGTWYYIAFVRSGSATNNFKLYINGSLDSQATMTTDFNNTARPLFVGHTPALDAGRDWNGYVDDFRITKGYARTVTTVPTAPFPVQ